MKIIDLLNKIANKEELPEKIIYENDYWKVGFAENGETDYLNDCEFELFNQYLEHTLIECLNDEIEILEDEEMDIQEIEELDKEVLNGLDGFTLTAIEEVCIDKINEIIRVVNKMQEKEYYKESEEN